MRETNFFVTLGLGPIAGPPRIPALKVTIFFFFWKNPENFRFRIIVAKKIGVTFLD